MTELIAVFGGVCNDGRHLLDRSAYAAITLREQAAEFVDRLRRLETDGVRIRTHPRAGVQTTRPLGQIVALESLEQLALDAQDCGHFIERNLATLAVAAKPSDKGVLGIHGWTPAITPAISAPQPAKTGCGRFVFSSRNLRTATKL